MAQTLLLHSCCAPCSSSVIERLSPDFAITVFYYNPNIYPKEEYIFRKEEQKRFIEEFPSPNPITYIEGDYDTESFYRVALGLENEPERGARCSECFKLRLLESAKKCKELGLDIFATTLTLSPHKDFALINKIGEEVAKSLGVEYLPSNFKKNNGYQRSAEISKEYGMYRQNYCGCEFSLSRTNTASTT